MTKRLIPVFNLTGTSMNMSTTSQPDSHKLNSCKLDTRKLDTRKLGVMLEQKDILPLQTVVLLNTFRNLLGGSWYSALASPLYFRRNVVYG
jgi:hypothetical protein